MAVPCFIALAVDIFRVDYVVQSKCLFRNALHLKSFQLLSYLHTICLKIHDSPQPQYFGWAKQAYWTWWGFFFLICMILEGFFYISWNRYHVPLYVSNEIGVICEAIGKSPSHCFSGSQPETTCWIFISCFSKRWYKDLLDQIKKIQKQIPDLVSLTALPAVSSIKSDDDSKIGGTCTMTHHGNTAIIVSPLCLEMSWDEAKQNIFKKMYALICYWVVV